MRIVHTADWHVGRTWKNLNRLPEMEAVLNHLARFVETQKVDLLLMAGDVFENTSPSPEAEQLVFRFFKRIGQGGTACVVIAGNHDQPARLDAWGMLTELVGVHTIGKPRRADQGGVRHIQTRSGTALVAALPFAPVYTWVSALELARDEGNARRLYADMFRVAVDHLSQSFRGDSVNLVMAHTHLDGARFGTSERQVHLGEDWAATPQSLPNRAHYVALGHIHQPQQITAAPAPTYYAGSALQLDFGEAGQEKSFLLVQAEPGRPVKVERVPYEGGRPLCDVRLSLEELEHRAGELAASGHVRVTVPLADTDPDLNRKVRALVPNALVVRPELPERKDDHSARPASSATPLEYYHAYHCQQHGHEPAADVADKFVHLYRETGG